jgi:hypothetical protein
MLVKPPGTLGGFYRWDMRYLIAGLFSMLFLFSSQAGEFKIIPSAAFGVVSEDRRSPHHYVKAGLQLRGPVYKEVKLKAEVALSLYQITYFGLPYTAVLGGVEMVKAVPYHTDERRYDYSFLLSYPLLKKKLQLDILFGYCGINLSNDFSSFHMGGPLIGLSAGIPYKRGSVHLKGDVTPLLQQEVENHRKDLIPFAESKTNSVLGDPTVATKYCLYWQAPLQKARRFAIGYEGETIFFQRTQRYYNGLAIAFIF